MNKIILAAVVLATFGSVAAQAADGRDPTLYGRPAQSQVLEGRNASVPTTVGTDAYIKSAIEQNARSTR